jgi:hypothetical protein
MTDREWHLMLYLNGNRRQWRPPTLADLWAIHRMAARGWLKLVLPNPQLTPAGQAALDEEWRLR